jgi:hypothetical protein
LDYLVHIPEADPKVQCNVGAEFKKPFQGLIPARYSMEAAVVNGEDAGTLNMMCHRYQAARISGSFLSVSAATAVAVYAGGTYTDTINSVLWLMIAPFMFWRGARRVAYVPNTDSLIVSPSASRTTEGPWGNGVLMSYNSDKRILFTELPWYKPELFLETVPTILAGVPSYEQVVNVSTQNYNVLWSVGDDFSVGCMATVPMILHNNPPAKRVETGRPRNKGGRGEPFSWPAPISLLPARKKEEDLKDLTPSSAPLLVRKTGS